MRTKINPKMDLRIRYKRVIQFALAFSLLLCIIIFQAFKKFDHKKIERKIEINKIEVNNITPPTSQEKPPVPPSRPVIPIESESEDIPDNVTIEDTDLNLSEMPEPPPPPEVEKADEIIFIPYDEEPRPLGGFKAIQDNLVYPELARKAGVQGKVVVQVQISAKGEVIKTKVIVPLGNSGCNEAAVAAIKSVKWEPAKQRDKPVTVWISIPIWFRLN